MKFTVVTPSYNQAQFLKRTLDSITAQSYREYEHILFDPGSTDGSIKLIHDYCQKSPQARALIGVDKSQTDAINRGFNAATGEILCWLNSDDQYCDANVFRDVQNVFANEPEADIVYGRGRYVDPDGKELRKAFVHKDAGRLRHLFANSLGILQPSLFIRKSVFDRIGPFDEKLNYSFDYEYWARAAHFGAKYRYFDREIAQAIIHEDAKTMRARKDSLEESMVVTRRYYSFSSVDWIRRLVDQQINEADGIIQISKEVTDEDILGPFREINDTGDALSRYFNGDPLMNEATKAMFAKSVIPLIEEAYLSGWDKNYFEMGVTLISSIHRYDPVRRIFVYDLGMTSLQRELVRKLSNVILLEHDFPSYSHDWQRNPKNYVFKNVLFRDLLQKLNKNASLLWVDAGVCLCEPPTTVFDAIRDDGYFFIDHDDSDFWPFFNASFTSDESIRTAQFTHSEMAGPHVCSCLFGAKVGGAASQMLEEAAKMAAVFDISVGDKHPEEKLNALSKGEQTEHGSRVASNKQPITDLPALRHVYGYYGHRQDQSILSALVTRYGLRISSAKRFCPANKQSSQVSKENWFEGVSRNVGQFQPNREHPGGVTFHHRGIVKDFGDLSFAFPKREKLLIHGGMRKPGPELLHAKQDYDVLTFGRSYLDWQNFPWKPTIHVEFNETTGWADRTDIRELATHACWSGLQLIAVRRKVAQWLASEGVDLSRVLDLDLLISGSRLLLSTPIANGSHALMFAQMLGYREVVLSGFGTWLPQTPIGINKTAENHLLKSWDALDRSQLPAHVSHADRSWLERYFPSV